MSNYANVLINDRPVSDVYWVASRFEVLELKMLESIPLCKIYSIRGANLRVSDDFLNAMCLAMNAPEHCIYSWDTLRDCMRGLEPATSPTSTYIFLYDAIEIFAKSSPDDFEIAMDIMQDITTIYRDLLPHKRKYVLLAGDQALVESVKTL
jgi:hypothetical protein